MALTRILREYRKKISGKSPRDNNTCRCKGIVQIRGRMRNTTNLASVVGEIHSFPQSVLLFKVVELIAKKKNLTVKILIGFWGGGECKTTLKMSGQPNTNLQLQGATKRRALFQVDSRKRNIGKLMAGGSDFSEQN